MSQGDVSTRITTAKMTAWQTGTQSQEDKDGHWQIWSCSRKTCPAWPTERKGTEVSDPSLEDPGGFSRRSRSSCQPSPRRRAGAWGEEYSKKKWLKVSQIWQEGQPPDSRKSVNPKQDRSREIHTNLLKTEDKHSVLKAAIEKWCIIYGGKWFKIQTMRGLGLCAEFLQAWPVGKKTTNWASTAFQAPAIEPLEGEEWAAARRPHMGQDSCPARVENSQSSTVKKQEVWTPQDKCWA